MVDVCLRTLEDTHLEVDRVAHDVYLCRVERVEEVAVVPVVVAYSVLVFGESLVHKLLVVDIALLHAEHGSEVVGVVHGVAHPCDVAHVVLLAFVYLHAHTDVFLVHVPHCVANDVCVAVAQLVVLLDELLLVVLPTLRCVLLLELQERSHLASLVSLLEHTFLYDVTLNATCSQCAITLDEDVAHLHLLLLIDDNVEYHLVFVSHVVALHDLYVGVLEAFLVEIAFSENLRTVDHVRCYLCALEQSEFLLHVCTLRLLQSDVVDGRHAWAHLQVYVQISLVVHERVDGYRYL